MTWVINNSGASLTYKAPDGTYESVANDTFDLWAGTTRLFNDIAATTTTQSLADIKFAFTAGTATIDIDNIVIDPIPSAPSTPTFSGVSSSGFTVEWGAVSGATGYRLDIDDNSDFSSPLAGYNDLAVAGTSQAVTGLSASTTYYARVRTENSAGTSNHSTSASQATSAAGSPTLSAVTLSGALSTTTGTASPGVSFTAAGTNLSASITATAQSGYEVSTDNSTFGSSVTVASGTTVYVRFAVSQSAGTYNSATAVVLSSTGATNVNVSTTASANTVSAAPVVVFTEGLNNSATQVSLGGTGGSYYSGNSSTTTWPNDNDLFAEGTHSYGRSGTSGNVTITSNAIDTTYGTSMSLSFRLAAFAGTDSQGMEDSDTVTLATSTDNGTTWSNEIQDRWLQHRAPLRSPAGSPIPFPDHCGEQLH